MFDHAAPAHRLPCAGHADVDAFWQADTDAGYRADGEPGPRPQYVKDIAFPTDVDVEVVDHHR